MSSLLRTTRLGLFLLAALVPACGAPPAPTTPHAAPPEASADLPAPKRPVPPGQLRREDVLGVLSKGPPAFLSQIEVEPSLDAGGRFRGWRIVQIREPSWAGGDLRPGDVVRAVNRRTLERDGDFFEVFQSLAFAPELRITVDRGGAVRELLYPINDDPSGPPVPRATVTERASDSPAPLGVRARTLGSGTP